MWKSFLSLWLKFPCPLCNRIAERTVCEYCTDKIWSYRLDEPWQNWQGSLPLFAWGRYDGELKLAIAKLKYNNQPEVGTLLGEWLGKSWRQNNRVLSKIRPIVVPIPLHRVKQQARGYNQAELIARGFCNLTGYSLANKAVMRIKDTKPMFGLTPSQRTNNLDGAFALSKSWQTKPPKRPILLIDDIYTQGTTVKEVTKLLQGHQIEVIGVITVALAR